MAVRVRVKNFQSIKEAEVLIDGLTVVTGTNNSGKTALMRAIQGVFTNPPAGALLRRGAAYLSVELEFSDGTKVLWEKGWEKPDQRGSAINRYYINGQEIPLAGRGAPSEVAALGVREVPAGTDILWPQLASQFDGVLFLVNRPGSATAEALSDVEKVGTLTAALRDAEKDRRSAESELKVRRKDVAEGKERVRRFDGLPALRKETDFLVESFARAEAVGGDLAAVRRMHEKWTRVQAVWKPLKDFAVTVPPVDPATVLLHQLVAAQECSRKLQKVRAAHEPLRDFAVELPEAGRAQALLAQLTQACALAERHHTVRMRVEQLASFHVSLPDGGSLEPRLADLAVLRTLAKRRSNLLGKVQALKLSEPPLGDPARASRLADVLSRVRSFRERRGAARDLVRKEEGALLLAEKALASAETEVTTILGDQGYCPTCQTPYQGASHGHASAADHP